MIEVFFYEKEFESGVGGTDAITDSYNVMKNRHCTITDFYAKIYTE